MVALATFKRALTPDADAIQVLTFQAADGNITYWLVERRRRIHVRAEIHSTKMLATIASAALT